MLGEIKPKGIAIFNSTQLTYYRYAQYHDKAPIAPIVFRSPTGPSRGAVVFVDSINLALTPFQAFFCFTDGLQGYLTHKKMLQDTRVVLCLELYSGPRRGGVFL